jgi:2-polyprenyl-3-methyl-5-hydroxy-6-metoxy-1,4-benzoquinol methylase/uncharacterized protein YbaR (Trm112 family)
LLESTVNFLRCIHCNSKLDTEIYSKDSEIIEGFLVCTKCNHKFPIIDKIPIIWNDFSKFLFKRKSLGEELYGLSKSQSVKQFVKNSMKSNSSERSQIEKHWTQIYQNSRNSKFYQTLKKFLLEIDSKISLEYGCSIGTISSFLGKQSQDVFGIDRSFYSIQIAKRRSSCNVDYIVSDALSPIFGAQKFDLIVGLNILELINPSDLISHVSRQITSGHLVISDPYDFERGSNSVETKFDSESLRDYLSKSGFKISKKTRIPVFVPWNLKINERTTLNYKVDVIDAIR